MVEDILAYEVCMVEDISVQELQCDGGYVSIGSIGSIVWCQFGNIVVWKQMIDVVYATQEPVPKVEAVFSVIIYK